MWGFMNERLRDCHIARFDFGLSLTRCRAPQHLVTE